MESSENKAPEPAKKGTNYDPHITPAETAARIEREGTDLKKPPVKEGDIDTTSGYTVDKEGLANNYAIEPEMYVNEPGDMREEIEEEKVRRDEEMEEVNTDGGKGVGLI